MRSPPPAPTIALDWVIRARRYDYHLTPDTPLHADINYHPTPRPLELDLHHGIELGLLLEGAEERHYQGHLLHCRPGDVWLCAMWEPHGWRTTRPHTRNLVFLFLPQFLGDESLGPLPWLSLLALPPEKRPTVSSPQLRAHTLAIAHELHHELLHRPPGWPTAVRLNLLRLLLALSRHSPPLPRDPDSPPVRTHDLARVMPALTLVHTDLHHRVSASHAAAACRLSRSHFQRLFTDTLGLSFARFCRRARLAFAAHLLLSTPLSLDTIAEQAGFTDASHLHRTFLSHYHASPGEYRKSRGGERRPV